MAAVMFDTQKFVKRLQAANFPPEQAEAHSEAICEVLETAFASHAKEQQDISIRAVESLDSKTEKALVALKHDVNERFAKTDAKIDKLEAKLDAKINNLNVKLDTKIDKLEAKLDAKIDKLEAKVDNLALGLRKDIENLDQRMTARFTLLQWMLGALVAGMVTLLVRTFTA